MVWRAAPVSKSRNSGAGPLEIPRKQYGFGFTDKHTSGRPSAPEYFYPGLLPAEIRQIFERTPYETLPVWNRVRIPFVIIYGLSETSGANVAVSFVLDERSGPNFRSNLTTPSNCYYINGSTRGYVSSGDVNRLVVNYTRSGARIFCLNGRGNISVRVPIDS